MATAKVDEITLRDVRLEVWATPSGGWQIRLPDEDEPIANGNTLEAAKRGADGYLKRREVKVGIPFRTLDGAQGEAHGIHRRNRTILARIGSRSHELKDYTPYLSADTPQGVIERIRELKEMLDNATTERDELIRKHRIDLRKQITIAIETGAAEKR